MHRSWKRLGGEVVLDLGIIRLRRDTYEFESRPAHPFHVIESNPWVNVVPVTDTGQVVLVRQYRHGIQGASLEVPGGVVDARDVSPRAAAERELLEETGYAAGRWTSLGQVTSNPAILDNRTHFFLASGVRREAEPSPDETEDLEVELRDPREVEALIERGEIHHSLSVCALSRYFLRALRAARRRGSQA
jgi:8-oxo-dGTP pyrophosphatase MutT (NUDIX family)